MYPFYWECQFFKIWHASHHCIESNWFFSFFSLKFQYRKTQLQAKSKTPNTQKLANGWKIYLLQENLLKKFVFNFLLNNDSVWRVKFQIAHISVSINTRQNEVLSSISYFFYSHSFNVLYSALRYTQFKAFAQKCFGISPAKHAMTKPLKVFARIKNNNNNNAEM